MTTPLPDADAVRRALDRRSLIYGLTVDNVMAVVGPVLEERDAEIARLRGHSCCDHEGWYDSRCACCNRKAAAEAVKNGSGELVRYVLVCPKRNPATGASG
jgi:hypothetical protein